MRVLVEAHAMDCIIMGTDDAAGIKEILTGSRTMHIVKESSMRDIGVPAGYRFVKLEVLLL